MIKNDVSKTNHRYNSNTAKKRLTYEVVNYVFIIHCSLKDGQKSNQEGLFWNGMWHSVLVLLNSWIILSHTEEHWLFLQLVQMCVPEYAPETSVERFPEYIGCPAFCLCHLKLLCVPITRRKRLPYLHWTTLSLSRDVLYILLFLSLDFHSNSCHATLFCFHSDMVHFVFAFIIPCLFYLCM